MKFHILCRFRYLEELDQKRALNILKCTGPNNASPIGCSDGTGQLMNELSSHAIKSKASRMNRPNENRGQLHYILLKP